MFENVTSMEDETTNNSLIFTNINPNCPQYNKIQNGSQENALSLITSQEQVSYGHEIAARAATPKWRAMGVQGKHCANMAHS